MLYVTGLKVTVECGQFLIMEFEYGMVELPFQSLSGH